MFFCFNYQGMINESLQFSKYKVDNITYLHINLDLLSTLNHIIAFVLLIII